METSQQQQPQQLKDDDKQEDKDKQNSHHAANTQAQAQGQGESAVLVDRLGSQSAAGAAAGPLRAPRVSLKLADFDTGPLLGQGSFSRVVKARLHASGVVYALKVMDKRQLLRERKEKYARLERALLDALGTHPGVVKMHGHYELHEARHYAAELVLLLEFLRDNKVIHRDIKPENMLLTESGHIKLTDFGSAKVVEGPLKDEPALKSAPAHSFVGTAEYVSPEVINSEPVTYSADLWALGCVIFQLLSGQPPFKAETEYLTFQRVLKRDLNYTEGFPPMAKHLVDSLLMLKPSERLGANSLDALKAHSFFHGVHWDADVVFGAKAPDILPVKYPELELFETIL
eukprot:jgi/Chlat1/8853/Chrsp91S08153